MTTTYNFSLASDFGGSLKSYQLHKEIDDDGGITPNLIGVNTEGDDVAIIFDATLSGGEETTLNGLVSAHVPDMSKPRKQFFIFAPKRNTITPKNNWVLSGYFQYPGSDQAGTIDYIDLISCMDSGINNYDARVLVKNTGAVLVEKTGMTNTETATIDLGTVSNVPTDKTTLELQIRKNGGNNKQVVEIEQVIVYYGN